MAQMPVCRNKTCPKLNSNDTIILLGEGDDHWLFGCTICKGIEYKTKPVGWKRASQENDYNRNGRPEFARVKRIFGLGRHHT